jgi:cell division protein FtsB
VDIDRRLKKVNWTSIWRTKKVSQEAMMTEVLQQLLRDFEEKATVFFQQLIEKSEDLKNQVNELHSTCEMLRAEKAALKAENLKLKNGILHASETMRDFLQTIVAEADKAAAEVKDTGQKDSEAVM